MGRLAPPETAVAAEIRDLSHDGLGVADVGGRRMFIAGALPSEQVLVLPRRRRRRYQEADLVEVVAAASDRVTPACEYFGVCGGCALQHMSYAAQVRFKQNVAADAFERIGGLAPKQWHEPILGPEWRYRRRARLGVKQVEAKGRVLVGFRERSAALITDMRHCRVLAPPLDTALEALSELIGASTLARRIPQVEAAMGDEHGALVLRVLDPPQPRDEAAFRQFGERFGLDIYVQPGGPGTVRPLGAARTLAYSLADFGVRVEFAPTDFIQINAHVNARMVAAAVAAAELRSGDRVLDLYCGLGNFSLPLAKHAGEVFGVEGDAALVARAAANAERNAVRNARFLAADLDDEEWGFYREPWDVVLLDPPRTGAAAAANRLAALRPRKIVYVSCHAGTLARDAQTLVAARAYRLTSARILDMFPQTHHVEVMAVFDRVDG
jgi:23S rRNA (uracil1939-C5)-methyltransferase